MPDLLLELFSEEIPARMQRKAAGDLRKMVTDGLVDAGLTYEGVREYWTPRRLTLDIRGLTARSADQREERKGPRTDAPEKALAGFLRGAGLASIEEAQVREDPKKGSFYVAVIEKPGRNATDIIAELMPSIIANFPWPKSMRWGAQSASSGSLRWVRPLQSILCLFGPETEEPEVVNFEVGGIKASNITYGHRFHAPEAIKVKRFDDYASALEKAHVVLDADRRKQIIKTDATDLAFAQGLELVEDEALLEEVGNLVEWPVPIIGTFDEAFLDIPPEVIRLTIKENQKCFVLRKANGDLSSNFLMVSNIAASDGGVEIARGNAKVVNARLGDAKFFWETDLHTVNTEGFTPWVEKLDAVTFHAKLGTLGERVKRVEKLAVQLAPLVGADADLVRRAAQIAKADLNSQIIYEFPELQGLMGRRYAERAGEDAAVAAAIENHYKPLGPSDEVPSAPVSIAVALADKLEVLNGFWSIDEKPTGSKDPYALRRAALGVIRLVFDNNIKLDLADWAKDVLPFFHDRLKVYLRDAGSRHDLIDAVLREGDGNLLAIKQRVEALAAFLDTEDGTNLLAGTKRAANILAAEEKKKTKVAESVDSALFDSEAETNLFAAIEQAETIADSAMKDEKVETAIAALASLRAPVDQFFDDVMVNVDDESVRANRLALMKRIRTATARVADFSRIAG